MSRTYPEGIRRNQGSSATAAFQPRCLIPFLARWKTKGHHEEYEGSEVGSYEKEDEPRVIGPTKKRGNAIEDRGGRRLSDIFLSKRPRFIQPGTCYPRSRIPNWLLNSIPSACLLFLSPSFLSSRSSFSRPPPWECYEKPRTCRRLLSFKIPATSIEPSYRDFTPDLGQFRWELLI